MGVYPVKLPSFRNFKSVVLFPGLTELLVFYNTDRPGFSAWSLKTKYRVIKGLELAHFTNWLVAGDPVKNKRATKYNLVLVSLWYVLL